MSVGPIGNISEVSLRGCNTVSSGPRPRTKLALRHGNLVITASRYYPFLAVLRIPLKAGEDTVIQSFGLHWRIDRVQWGRPAVAGTLLGAASRSPRARAVDFREQRGIYALYADYDLVYVGQTGAGKDRLFRRLRVGPESISGKAVACGERLFRRARGANRRPDKLRSCIRLCGAAILSIRLPLEETRI